jgi:hypothetical protein
VKEVYWTCNRPWDFNFIRDHLVDEEDKSIHGRTVEATQKVTVTRRETCRDTERDTALHETHHCHFKSASNGLPSEEEDAVVAVTTAQYSAFRDRRNLWFWRMMLEGIADVVEIPEGTKTPRKGTRRK